MRQRPGANAVTGALRSTGISRLQWRARGDHRTLTITSVGRRRLP